MKSRDEQKLLVLEKQHKNLNDKLTQIQEAKTEIDEHINLIKDTNQKQKETQDALQQIEESLINKPE